MNREKMYEGIFDFAARRYPKTNEKIGLAVYGLCDALYNEIIAGNLDGMEALAIIVHSADVIAEAFELREVKSGNKSKNNPENK